MFFFLFFFVSVKLQSFGWIKFQCKSFKLLRRGSRQVISLMSQGLSARCPVCRSHTHVMLLPHTRWKIEWATHYLVFFPASFRECGLRVPAGSRPCVLTFLSPEKMTRRSYRSCLARERREGRGGGGRGTKGWARGSLSMRTSRALRLLICMSYLVGL